MSKIIGMIPARLNSQRVSKKNLRIISNKPLIAHAVCAAKDSGVFDEIYINSEADIFGEIAYDYGVKFYKRPAELASNSAINDDFAYDFIKNVKGDILVQFLSTAPLIGPDEVKGFVNEMVDKKFDTLVSVEDHKIACVYKGKPVNFRLLEPHMSSQEMAPVQSYVTVLMAWTYQSFTRNMKKYGFAYHGADSKIGYYPLTGFSTIDIDNEEDFALAEAAFFYRDNFSQFEPKYYQGKV